MSPLIEDTLIALGFRQAPVLPDPQELRQIHEDVHNADQAIMDEHDSRYALIEQRMERFERRLAGVEMRLGVRHADRADTSR